MREVVWKDLLLNRVNLAVNVLIFTLSFAALTYIGMDTVRPVAVFGGFMAAFLPVTIITREDRSRAMALACSLPVTRRTIVRGRYAMGVVLALASVLLIMAIVAILPTSALTAGQLFRPTPLLTSFAVVFLIMAIMMPLTLWLGSTGLILMLVGFQVLGIVLLSLTQLFDANFDRRVIGAIIEFLVRAAATLGNPSFHLVLFALLSVGLALSYRVSVFLFERREL